MRLVRLRFDPCGMAARAAVLAVLAAASPTVAAQAQQDPGWKPTVSDYGTAKKASKKKESAKAPTAPTQAPTTTAKADPAAPALKAGTQSIVVLVNDEPLPASEAHDRVVPSQ